MTFGQSRREIVVELLRWLGPASAGAGGSPRGHPARTAGGRAPDRRATHVAARAVDERIVRARAEAPGRGAGVLRTPRPAARAWPRPRRRKVPGPELGSC